MTQNAIIITGQIRSPELFLDCLSTLKTLKDEDLLYRIIYVLWTGELDAYPEIRKQLELIDVEIIETESALVSGISNIWHQMKALDVAIHEIPKGYYVLKTRPDVNISLNLMRRLFNGYFDLSLPNNRDMPKIFKARIWVPWFEISKPFYIADECFFGLREDVVKLYNYDARFDVIYSIDSALSHIRRFIHPFLDSFPLFNTYLKYYGRSFHSNPFYESLLNARLKSNVYMTLLAAYYRIINHYFYVSGNDKTAPIEFRTWLPPSKQIPQNRFSEAFNIKYSWDQKESKRIYAYDHAWVDSICRKEMKIDRITTNLRLIYKAFEQFDLYGYNTFKFNQTQINADVNFEKHISGQIHKLNFIDFTKKWFQRLHKSTNNILQRRRF